MEKLAIILRKSAAENKFRDIILRSFEEPGFTEIVICSGFFQERGKYFASNCFLTSTPHVPCCRTVTAVGVYNGIWKGDFDSFVSGLRKITCSCPGSFPLPVIKRRITRYHWHAKIFIALDKEGPQLGIIGSSNITSRAFGLLPTWNFEADSILWNDSNSTASAVMEKVFEFVDGDNSDSIIVGNYATDDKRNFNRSLQDRLRSLIEEIEELSEVIKE